MKKILFLSAILGLGLCACENNTVEKTDPLPENQQTIQPQDTTSQSPDKTENPIYNDTTGHVE